MSQWPTAQQWVDCFTYAATAAGLFGTFYYGVKSTRLQKRLTRFTWSEVEVGVDFICKRIIRIFKPDVILTLSVPGGIVSSLIMIKSIHVALHYEALGLRDGNVNLDESQYVIVQTSKFKIAIPKAILALTAKNILIIDSAVITGDLLLNVVSSLKSNGFPPENIKSASLLVTEFAIQAGKAPDVYWRSVKDTDYALPWGNLSFSWY